MKVNLFLLKCIIYVIIICFRLTENINIKGVFRWTLYYSGYQFFSQKIIDVFLVGRHLKVLHPQKKKKKTINRIKQILLSTKLSYMIYNKSFKCYHLMYGIGITF